MTALQVIIKEAKAIRKKSPKMEWKKAVAQASAIYASKHKGKSPVGKKKVAKKAAKKKIGYSKTRLKTEKGITKYLKSSPKTLFPYTTEEKIIKAGKKYFDDKAKELHNKGVSGVKRKKSAKKVGAVKKSATTMHKDTKSHNVNIRVMSGVGALSSQLISELKQAHDKLIKWQKVLLALEKEKKTVSKQYKAAVGVDIYRVKEAIKEQKIHITQLKKHIK
jgi:hypothetical protein